LEIGERRPISNLQSPISNRPSLGCDIEFVEPREGNFLDNFFTAAEVAAVREVRERWRMKRTESAPAESALKRTGAADLTGLSRFPMSDADFNRREDGAADPTGLSRFPMADADFNRRELGEAGALAPADILTTAIWSGKEAVLKALREGLRIDTRRITCRFDEFAAPPQEWTPFAVIVDEGLAAQFPGVWSGWWRVKDRFALTMALLQETEL
jgi:hypothetical protein